MSFRLFRDREIVIDRSTHSEFAEMDAVFSRFARARVPPAQNSRLNSIGLTEAFDPLRRNGRCRRRRLWYCE